MERMLLISQYNTRPDGNVTMKAKNITGIHTIIFAMFGSSEVGISFC